MADGIDTTANGIPFDGERRQSSRDRRKRLVFSLFYGGLKPRRRAGRRASDHHQPIVDWHGPGLLASSVLVLILCSLDAFLTLWLMTVGAVEANPLMAPLVAGDAQRFAITKLAMTGAGILTCVALANFRVFRLIRVATLVHTILVAYLVLVGYELALLAQHA
ncbi:MAG: hypothetical protein JSR73_10645 [Proteobacteria bacterium]|nr:hypothetical protein [Pseudomonadota bacterium]